MTRIDIDETEPRIGVSLGQALLRVALGSILISHGAHKLFALASWQQQLAELGVPAPEIIAPATLVAELLGGAGLILGLLTRLAAFAAIVDTALVLAIQHLRGGLVVAPERLDLLEAPLLLVAVSLFILLAGGGSLSADAQLRRRALRRAIERDAIWLSPPYVAVAEGPSGRDNSYAERRSRSITQRRY